MKIYRKFLPFSVTNVFARTACLYALAILMPMLVGLSAADANAEQCVYKRGSYVAQVDWYKASDVYIDNSEPWNNRLLIRRSQSRSSGRCGPDLNTGKLVCRGVHVDPISTKVLSSIASIANSDKGRSCVSGDDNFAVITCKGCAQGVSAVVAAAGSVAGAIVPGGSLTTLMTTAATIADSQNVGPTTAVTKALSDSASSFKLENTSKHKVSIHDLNDLSDTYQISNVLYVGTPKPSATIEGSFIKPHVRPHKPKFTGTGSKITYSLEVDCHMRGVSNTDTTDTIIVEWLGKDKTFIGSSLKYGENISCGPIKKNSRFGLRYTNEEVVGFRIRTTGRDGFMIDQLNLVAQYYQGGTKELLLGKKGTGGGVDGGRGWCMSTDPGDASGEWTKVTDDCKETRIWRIQGKSW